MPVAIQCQNSPLFLAALGAVAKLGAIAALINTHLEGAGLTHVLGVSGARVGICDQHAVSGLERVAGTHPVHFFTDATDATLSRGVDPIAPATRPAPEPDIPDVRGGDVFLYIYTSATTGYPKPAIVRHLRFTMGGVTLSQLLGIEPGETVYAPLPLYHGESLFVGFSPAFRVDDVRRHEAVAFVYVGELCRYLLRQPASPHDRDHRLRVAAGAGLRPDIWAAFQERFRIPRIIEMYGATEGNIALQNDGGPRGSVGRPHPLLEDQLQLARFDLTRGELVRGRNRFCVPRARRRPERDGVRRLHRSRRDRAQGPARRVRAG
jgi:fatty-acyl-CoA synthase